MTVNERIERLRHLMAERNIDIYIIQLPIFTIPNLSESILKSVNICQASAEAMAPWW